MCRRVVGLSPRADAKLAEHFELGKEMAYFDGIEDLPDRVRYYLEHEEERLAIAKAGENVVGEVAIIMTARRRK